MKRLKNKNKKKPKALINFRKFRIPEIIDKANEEKFNEIKNYFSKTKLHISNEDLLNSYDFLLKDFCKIKLNEEKKKLIKNQKIKKKEFIKLKELI